MTVLIIDWVAIGGTPVILGVRGISHVMGTCDGESRSARRSLIRRSESRAVDWYINEFSTTLYDAHGAMGQEGRRSQAGQLA